MAKKLNKDFGEIIEDEGIEIRSRKEIPKFANEEEEAAFWSEHTLATQFFTRRGPSPRVQRLLEQRGHQTP